jgi:glycosyltransferase involved in cell wall biosynthesis
VLNSKPLVSVIMNCFNGERYLVEAINSVLEQQYSNWELIFWDNQSTDRSAQIFQSFEDIRLKYYYAPFHSPLYEARNYAIEKSSGDFLAFLDVDDWWLPTKLKEQLPLFDDHNVGLVFSNFKWKNEIKNIEYIAHNKNLPSGYVLGEILNNYVVGLLTIIIRRDSYNQLRYKFNPKYNVIGDFDLVIRLSIDWKFASLQSQTAYCRWHGNNLQISEEKEHISELEHWVDNIKSNPTISKKLEFKNFENNIKRMKSVYRAQNGDFFHSIKSLFIVTGLKNKVKILAAILLPRKIFENITRR